LLEGVRWLLDPSISVKVAGKSGISQARSRLGAEPMRRLHEEIVGPIATRATRGAWFKHWHLVSLDGSTLDVADEPANVAAFGRPAASRGLIHEAALKADEDPDSLSFLHAVRVIRQKLTRFSAVSPSAPAHLP
jgi:hypothetical protein